MSPSRFLVVIAVAAGATALAACSAAPDPAPTARAPLLTCVPNQTIVCTCGIDDGTQRCTEEGRLTPCECGGREPEGTLPAPVPSEPGPAPPPVKPGPTCGDSTVDRGEACDDGNTKSGDGCSAQCQPDGAPASADACPGQHVTLWSATTVVLSGTTEGYANNLQASCWSSAGADRVYAIHPTADGNMSIDAVFAAGFNAVVEVRKDSCALPSAQTLCEDTLSKPFKRVVPVSRNSIYYLIIDGDTTASKGAYTVRIELP